MVAPGDGVQSVADALDGYVQLSTEEKVATRSLIWCVGVRADPLVAGLDLATSRGRLVVDELMSVPGAADIYACGDCAAVPDLPPRSAPRRPAPTSTTTRASWWTWAGWPPPRNR